MSYKDSDIILYLSEDGATKIDVRLEGETVWLTQAQMAELFQTTPQNITLHIKNVYSEGELSQDSTCKEYLQVQNEGDRSVSRNVKHYNLDVIIAVGYRVKSLRGGFAVRCGAGLFGGGEAGAEEVGRKSRRREGMRDCSDACGWGLVKETERLGASGYDA